VFQNANIRNFSPFVKYLIENIFKIVEYEAE